MYRSAIATAKMLRVSPRKLTLVANFIQGMKAQEALTQLKFLNKRIAKDVRKCLQAAVSNAENNFGYDIDSLFVTSATVGKALTLKRFMPRAKGRASSIHKYFSNLYITVTEKGE